MNLGLFFLMWILGLIGTLFLNCDEPNIEPVFILALLPIFNIFGILFGIINTFIRIFESRGKCIFRHKFRRLYERVGKRKEFHLVGGFDNFSCSRCKTKRSVKWRAF